MMLTTQNIESELSYAYLHAVASRAGIICESTGRHTDEAGVDSVLRVKGMLAQDSILTQFPVEVQLKATKQIPIEQNGRFSYSLKVKNYNELRSTNTGAPQLPCHPPVCLLVKPTRRSGYRPGFQDCLYT
jgi:hypothetical protein